MINMIIETIKNIFEGAKYMSNFDLFVTFIVGPVFLIWSGADLIKEIKKEKNK